MNKNIENSAGEGFPILIKGVGPYFAVPISPAIEAAEKRAESYSERLISACAPILDEIGQEISVMPVSSRYSPTAKVRDKRLSSRDMSRSEIINPEITEAEYRRAHLDEHLTDIQREIYSAAAHLANLVRELEETKME